MPVLTPDAWAQIRYAYEHTDRPVEDICLEYGTTSTTLRDRMRRWRWTRRRPPIPREGPPPVAVALPTPEHDENPPHPTPTVFADAQTADPPPPGEGEEPQVDPAAIVPRLQSAVARVLPAIEATIARLAAGPYHPREMEQAGRALSSLTRTLRELNALLSEHHARAEAAGDRPRTPEEIDEFRMQLARKIREIVQARQQNDEEAKPQET